MNIQDNLDQIQELLQSIADFDGKTVQVLSEDDFMEKVKGTQKPCVAVMYEGLRATNAGDKDTHKVGLGNIMSVSLILVLDSKGVFGADPKKQAPILLDAMRNKIKDTRAVTGHFWRFVMEAPAMEKGSLVLWIQRWSTPVHLT